MTPTQKVIAPRTPDSSRSQLTTGGLPDDLLGEHVRRLRLCAAVAMGLWTFGLVMDGLARPRIVGAPIFPSHHGNGASASSKCGFLGRTPM